MKPLSLQQTHIGKNIKTSQEFSQTQGCAGPPDDFPAKAHGGLPDGVTAGCQIPPDHGQGCPVGQKFTGDLRSQPLLAQGVLKEPMLKMLPATFSFPQLLTALIGGAVALAIAPVLKKALRK